MSLLQFIAANQPVTWNDLRRKPSLRALVLDTQNKLTSLGILDPFTTASTSEAIPFKPLTKQDGMLGGETLTAIRIFSDLIGIPVTSDFTPTLATALQNAEPGTIFGPLDLDLQNEPDNQTRLAKRLLLYMQQEGYWFARVPGMLNIVYAEGIDRQGLPNADLTNDWNDRRILFSISQGKPVMHQNFDATTEPGWKTIENPRNKVNAVAQIAFGQYKAWQMGKHTFPSLRQRQEALHQEETVRVYRDVDKNGKRWSQATKATRLMQHRDWIDEGIFGINQHSVVSDRVNHDKVQGWSAGCLVGRFLAEHRAFLKLLRTDIRYQNNAKYMFMTAVVNGDLLQQSIPDPVNM